MTHTAPATRIITAHRALNEPAPGTDAVGSYLYMIGPDGERRRVTPVVDAKELLYNWIDRQGWERVLPIVPGTPAAFTREVRVDYDEWEPNAPAPERPDTTRVERAGEGTEHDRHMVYDGDTYLGYVRYGSFNNWEVARWEPWQDGPHTIAFMHTLDMAIDKLAQAARANRGALGPRY
jgi:hypothetical protein